jgi:hypothetical protein
MIVRRALFLAALLAAAGCKSEVPASLLLTVTSTGEAPSLLRLSVFDGKGQAHDEHQFIAPAGARGSLGTLVVYPRAGGSLSLRVQGAGLLDEQVVAMGAISIRLTAGKQSTAKLTLIPVAQAVDRDGDGVLDEIDNCPGRANPGQQDATEDGTGDDCGDADASAADSGSGSDAGSGSDGGTGARALAAACTDGSQCQTGFCVDGVCCESACRDVCRACNLPDMGGQCAAIPAGQPDRRGGCAAQTVDTCGLDGACNGAGACRRHPAGTVCRPAACALGSERTLPATCDGNGTCGQADTLSCAPYACAAGSCVTVCQSASDCAPGVPCSNGSCGKKPLGAPCAGGSECQSTHCIDGVCCETGDCSGACRSCNVVGAAGSCRELPTNAEPRAAGCPAEPTASCGRTGKCDGAGGCQLYPAATPCGPRSCTAAVETLVPTCNGGGVCVPAGTQTCGSYQCGGDACATSCSDDNGCAAGMSCVGGLCIRKRDLGAACTQGGECLSGFCADGYCCQTACTETCRRCDATGVCTVLTSGRDNNATPACAAPKRCLPGGTCS